MMDKTTKTTLALFLLTISYEPVFAASPILSVDIPPSARLLISRQSAKDNQNIQVEDYIDYDDKRDDAFNESTGECGNVNIGNIERDRPIGSAPRTVNVIVTGPVFNTVSDC